MKTKSKIWLGVGAFVVAGAGVSVDPLVAETAAGPGAFSGKVETGFPQKMRPS